jgi:hypothetical protein
MLEFQQEQIDRIYKINKIETQAGKPLGLALDPAVRLSA